ncbi:MAG: tetratricopeptide repeat protein [Acidobacteriota bacterium]|nr:tetratricopeptide repeat protein [Acidobacteriota bacterium]MDH3524545.1 tetratricopeptide repeat protein [Acidobacteriota bacterium]
MKRTRRSVALSLSWILVLAAGSCLAAAAPEDFHLSRDTRSTLAAIQQDWSEWLAAYELNDGEAQDLALEGLVDGAAELGMKVLPELSLAAAVRAVESAGVGDRQRALRALEAAERLDPGRPETSFASAAIHRLEGSWGRFLGETARGYVRALGVPAMRRAWRHNLVLWLLTTLLLAGCAYVAILMLVRGPALVGSLLKALRRHLPVPVGVALILALLVWPLLLPARVQAVVLNWIILLWAYCVRSERWVLGCLLLAFGLTPIVLDEQRRQVGVEMASPVRAAEDARDGRLGGTVFGDLQRLAIVLPDSTAVLHLIADQHRRMGQCDQARGLYERVVEREPRNAGAWVDLGSCRFLGGEYGQAIESYRRGVAIDPDLAQAHFNLSLAFSELYRFAEADLALRRAQEIDSGRVAAWLKQTPRRAAAEVAAGLERSREIRRDLKASWVFEDDGAAWSSPWRDYLSVPLALAGVLLAALVGRFLPVGLLEERASPLVTPAAGWGTLYRVLVPGLPDLEAGEPLRGLAGLVIVCGLLLVPWASAYGYRQPWGYEPAAGLGWAAALLGLALFFLLRWRREVEF